jgi:PAS domain S-box-containing protein
LQDAGTPPDWTALAHRALLHQASRGDALKSLVLLRRHLVAAGRQVALGWRGEEGAMDWLESAAPPASTLQTQARAAQAPAGFDADGCWWLPLDHLAERVGLMCVQGAPGDRLTDFEPLCATAAALLTLVRRGTDHPARAQADTVKAALKGAGAFVWEWDPVTDELADIDEGFAMLGYPDDTFRPTQDSWNRLIHPEDLAANDAAYQRHARGETPHYEHVYRALAADGSWRWIHERGRIVERAVDGSPRRMLGTQTDVTLQREFEASASSATQRLELIARNVPGVLYQFKLSADGTRGWFPFVSERCEAVFGVPHDVLTNDAATLFRLVDPSHRDRVEAAIALSATHGTPWRGEFPVRRRDGQVRWILGTSSPQRDVDGSTSWFGYMADVTDLRELEAALRDKAAAEAASRAKTEFLSRMSHELRTPLNAVLGFSQLLEMARDPALAEPHRRHVRLIRDAGEHLLSMIGDLLDLTRIESGQLALQTETVALAPAVQESLALLQAQADAAGLQVRSLLEPAHRMRADRTRLKQILLNLLSNAVKYNRRGGSVTLTARTEGPLLRLDVADTGVGIADEHLRRLFEPFQRGAHQSSAIEGTGIGLAVSRSLALAMGGRIEVFSRQGEGSVFSLLLPSG